MIKMTRDELIQAARHFVGATEKDDSEIVATLIEDGLGLAAAERVAAFLPIAFGRVVLSHLAKITFTTDYVIHETGQTRSLSSEPIFTAALALATESYHSGILAKETFSAIATRSAEMAAVSKAMNDGADVNGASLRSIEFSGYKTLGKSGWLLRVFGR